MNNDDDDVYMHGCTTHNNKQHPHLEQLCGIGDALRDQAKLMLKLRGVACPEISQHHGR